MMVKEYNFKEYENDGDIVTAVCDMVAKFARVEAKIASLQVEVAQKILVEADSLREMASRDLDKEGEE